MKKKLIPFITALVCAIGCLIAFSACNGKELNYLKVLDTGTGQYKSELDLGTFSSDQLDGLNAKLSDLKFIFEYYPDNSIEDADMTKVKTKHFYSNGDGTTTEEAGIPQTLQKGANYSLYYYYEGHEPTADFSDALCVRIQFSISND